MSVKNLYRGLESKFRKKNEYFFYDKFVPYQRECDFDYSIINLKNVFSSAETTFIEDTNEIYYEQGLTGNSYTIKYTNGGYLMILVTGSSGSARGYMYNSTDGVNWSLNGSAETLLSGITGFDTVSIDDNGSDIVAQIGDDTIKSSNGGFTWGNLDNKSTDVYTCLYGNKWLTVGQTSGGNSYSNDGITWTTNDWGLSSNIEVLFDACWDGSQFIIGGVTHSGGSENLLVQSPDGVTASLVDYGLTGATTNIRYANNTYLLRTAGSFPVTGTSWYYSTNLSTGFTENTSLDANLITKVQYTDKWYGMGNSTILTSTDGINWTDETPSFLDYTVTDIDSPTNPKPNQ